MKVSAITESGAATTANLDEGKSAGAERIARAKAVLAGGTVAVTPKNETQVDPQVEKAQNSIKRIKLKTQMSSDRHSRMLEAASSEAMTAPEETVEQTDETVVDTLATTEPAVATPEATKPLSPQFAALMKEKRSLQLKEKEIAAREAALLTKGDMKSLDDYKAQLKANPLRTLFSEGVTYDQLTEAVLNDSSSSNEEIQELKAEIKALKEGVDKNFSDRDQKVEQQVLGDIRREADRLIATGDDFEMVREAGYAPQVVQLIHRIWKEKNELMDTSEAATLIENELLEESLKFAKIKKVQSRLTPAPQQQQIVQQDNPNRKIMRTLTNRDGVSSTNLSKRDRAIAIMEGRLKP